MVTKYPGQLTLVTLVVLKAEISYSEPGRCGSYSSSAEACNKWHHCDLTDNLCLPCRLCGSGAQPRQPCGDPVRCLYGGSAITCAELYPGPYENATKGTDGLFYLGSEASTRCSVNGTMHAETLECTWDHSQEQPIWIGDFTCFTPVRPEAAQTTTRTVTTTTSPAVPAAVEGTSSTIWTQAIFLTIGMVLLLALGVAICVLVYRKLYHKHCKRVNRPEHTQIELQYPTQATADQSAVHVELPAPQPESANARQLSGAISQQPREAMARELHGSPSQHLPETSTQSRSHSINEPHSIQVPVQEGHPSNSLQFRIFPPNPGHLSVNNNNRISESNSNDFQMNISTSNYDISHNMESNTDKKAPGNQYSLTSSQTALEKTGSSDGTVSGEWTTDSDVTSTGVLKPESLSESDTTSPKNRIPSAEECSDYSSQADDSMESYAESVRDDVGGRPISELGLHLHDESYTGVDPLPVWQEEQQPLMRPEPVENSARFPSHSTASYNEQHLTERNYPESESASGGDPSDVESGVASGQFHGSSC